MNAVLDLFTSMTDDELKTSINEIIESGKTGFIEDGFVRSKAKETSEITGQSVSETLFYTQINLLREAAYRWAKI